jgi:hypothetical protein
MKSRRRRLKRNREAAALQQGQFKQQVIPNKKKERLVAIPEEEWTEPQDFEPTVAEILELETPEDVELPDEADPIELMQIPSDMALKVWPLCSEFIKAGCEIGDLTEEDVRDFVELGSAELWFAWSDHLEAAAVTQIISSRDDKEVLVFLSLGGEDMSRWLGLLDDIENWARKRGAMISRTIGRKGWGRVLRDYRPSYYVYEKEL